MTDFRPTIVRLLTNLASEREIQLYLKRFSQIDAVRFAVVKVGGSVLRDEMGPLVSSLAFLQQVGLTPIVVHGGGPQLDEALAAAGIEKRSVEGLRYTSPAALGVVRRVLFYENLRLVEALQTAGVRATSLPSGVFEAEELDREKFGLVGRVREVRLEGVETTIRARSIPVIACLGETDEGQILNVNGDWAAAELVKLLQPYKIIFLTGTGGLLDDAGRIIESVNLSSDYEHLMSRPWVHSGMKVKLEQIHDLLMALPPTSSLSITRPDEMTKELFTHRGSGTLVRRGEKILRHESWDDVDRHRLRLLIESSFGSPLAEDYFERSTLERIYVTEQYRAAIVLADEGGIPYMDKFVVGEEAQGEGLGRAVWKVMRAETPRLFWRARRGNPIQDFYFTLSDGTLKGEEWTVFWAGEFEWDELRGAVERALAREATVLR